MMALPELPAQGQNPWFVPRNDWDLSVKEELEGRLSQSGLLSTISPASKNPVTGVAYAKDFGFSSSNTASQNSSALTSALASVGRSVAIELPDGEFAVNPFMISRDIILRGAGASVHAQYPFGDSRWANAGVITGTVLRFANTSGNSVEVIGSSSATNSVYIENIALVGPGTGTSVGLFSGQVGGLGYPVRLRYKNVALVNFFENFKSNAENSTFIDLYSVASTIGVSTFYPFNGNVFVGLNVESCSTNAIKLVDSDTNFFVGGVIQANTSEKVIYIEGVGYGNNKFTSLYMENRNAVRTWDVWVESGASNSFEDIHFGTNPTYNPGIHIGSNNNRVRGTNPPYDLEIPGSSNWIRLNTVMGRTITNTGTNNIINTQHTDNATFQDTKIVTANYSMIVSDDVVRTNGTGLIITLPSPATLNGGNRGKVWKVGTLGNACSVVANAGYNINGATTPITVPAWTVRGFVHDGTQWMSA